MDNLGLVGQPIENHYIFLMEQIIKRYREIAKRTLKQQNADLNVDEWIVLKKISEHNGCSQIELARYTSNGPAKMTRTIDALVSKQLIDKRHSVKDRRRHMIFVSEKGQQLIQRLWPEVLAYRQNPLNGFSENEKQTFLNLLQKMVQNIE